MAAGDPTGADLCSGTTNGNTLPEFPTYEEREISFGAGAALVSGVTYALVLKGAAGAINWDATIDNGYTNGKVYASSNAGNTWSAYLDSTYDAWFKTKAETVEKDTYPFGTGDDVGANGNVWVAQTFVAGSNYTITSVVLKIRRLGASPGTITASIRATVPAGPQKVTTPSPINTYNAMTLDWQAFSWVADGGAPEEEVYNVYFGTVSDDLDLIALQTNDLSVAQSYLQTVVGAGGYNTTYYWRVDSYWPSTEQTATGDVWSFSTIVFATPSGGGRGGVGGGSGGVSGDKQLNTKTRLVAFARNKVFYEDS